MLDTGPLDATLFHMVGPLRILKSVVTASLLMTWGPALAQDTDGLDELFAALKTAEPAEAARIERQIWEAWSDSGSAAMDLLLMRGRQAMNAGDAEAAIDHFSALIDHAPEFAEGYNARATAYFQADKFGLSLADIRSTLALNPRHFGALGGLAIILEHLGEPENALEVYRRVQAIHPNQENLEDAIERLEKAVGGVTL